MWRCPHCGTPQAETSRCWVCRRSSTACGTCRHFRRSVAAQVGYCGLDRRRQPLLGDEIRACWEAGPIGPAEPLPVGAPGAPSARADDGAPVDRKRDFIEIVSGLPVASLDAAVAPATDSPAPPSGNAEPRWSLWSDLEA